MPSSLLNEEPTNEVLRCQLQGCINVLSRHKAIQRGICEDPDGM